MTGTKSGGLKCKRTIYMLHGDDFYRRIGQKGGRVRSPLKGFGSNPTLAIEAGRKGGLISRKGKKNG